MTTEELSNTSQSGNSSAEPGSASREAIIFLPGLSIEAADESVERISLHLAAAIDRYAEPGRKKFRVGEVREEVFVEESDDNTVRVTTIFQDDAGQESPVVDVYKLDYGPLFQAKLQEEPLLFKMFRIPVTIGPAATRLIRHCNNKSLSWREKAQLAIVFLGFLCVLAYAILLVAALWKVADDIRVARAGDAVQPAPAPAATATANGESSSSTNSGSDGSPVGLIGWIGSVLAAVWAWLLKLGSTAKEWGTILILALAGIGLILPKPDEVRRLITSTATMIIAFIGYLQYGERRGNLSGNVVGLLEYIAQKEDVQYTRVHILAYSFGSLIALDTLFPRGIDTPKRVKELRSLVTIGSPFDFIHMLWPKYFANRNPLPDLVWYNIYSPEDVLSSNFRGHSKIESAQKGEVEGSSQDKEKLSGATWLMPPTNIKYTLRNGDDQLTFWDLLQLMGLRNHSKYWEREKGLQINAFDVAVSRMFKDSPLLQ